MDDLQVAKAYLNKFANAKSRNIEFTLSFSQFKKVYLTRKCFYTGLEMTFFDDEEESHNRLKFHSKSIDRIDASLGYVPGNVVACCNGINKLKGRIENDTDPLSVDLIEKMLRKWKKTINKK